VLFHVSKSEQISNIFLYLGDDDGYKYEVRCYPNKVVVNLATQTCTYRFWQLTGKCMPNSSILLVIVPPLT